MTVRHRLHIIKDPHANGSGEGSSNSGSRNGGKTVSFETLKENGLEKKLHDGNLDYSMKELVVPIEPMDDVSRDLPRSLLAEECSSIHVTLSSNKCMFAPDYLHAVIKEVSEAEERNMSSDDLGAPSGWKF